MADLMDLARAAARSNTPEEPEEETYTLADLADMDRLLHEIARLEGWSAAELADRLDQRRRMASVNVLTALRLLRAGANGAGDTKPDKPTKRVPVALCVIAGGKS
jgi:hypothetical protein